MDRKNKVWLIVLALLLVAAIVAVVVFNGKLSTANKDLETVSAQLVESQGANETLTTQLNESETKAGGLETELSESTAKVTELETQLTESTTKVTELETQLNESETKLTELETQLTESTAKVTELETQLSQSETKLTESETKVTALETQLTESATKVTELETELAESSVKVGELEVQLTEATEKAEALSAQQNPAADKTESALIEAQITELVAVIETAETQLEHRNIQADLEVQPEKPNGEDIAQVESPISAEALFNGETIDVDATYEAINTIVYADSSVMNDAEKLAALGEIKTALLNFAEQYGIAQATIEANASVLAESQSNIDSLETQLSAAQNKVSELTAAIEAGNETITALEAQVDVLTGENADLSAESEANVSELMAQIAVETAKVSDLTSQLTDANRELAELQAYMLSRELGEGQAHTASTMGSAIVISDGVNATWNYINDLVSGNAVVVTISVDDAEIFVSETLNPGEALYAFTLTEALTSGNYDGVVTTAVYNAAGEYLSASRVPITVIVN